MSHVSRLWFLRKENGAVYGPVAEEVLAAWAADGRVAPEDFISPDQIIWTPPNELPSLGMEWMIELGPGLEYGPAHERALLALVDEGAVEPPVRLRNIHTGEVRVVGAPPHKGDTQRITAEAAPPTKPVAGAIESSAPVPTPAEDRATLSGSADGLVATMEAVATDTAIAEIPSDAGAGASEPSTPNTVPSTQPGPSTPARTLSWQKVAHERDFYEKEAARWQALYEQERTAYQDLQRQYDELAQRAEQERLEWDRERDQLRRRITELEEELGRAAERNRSADAQLVEAYHELIHNFELLSSQVMAKDQEIQTLRGEVDALRRERDTQWEEIQHSRRREAELLQQTRQRLEELEHAHLELLRSYRDLNDRYIRLRSGGVPASPAAPESGGGSERRPSEPGADASSGPRVRLWR